MYRDHTVGVVITAYNEEGLVGDVIDSVPSFVDEVYAVDDCSTDNTWAEITEHMAMAPAETSSFPLPDGGHRSQRRVVPVRHEQNRGVGGAIKSGFQEALDSGVDIVAVMDGDGQMDPAHLDRLLDPIVDGRASYAKGNRLAKRSHIESMSWFRLFGNVLLTILTRIASGYWRMRDPQNGYNAIDTATLERIPLSQLHDRYGFRNDVLIRLSVEGATIADVTMPAVYGEEESGIHYTAFIPRLSWLLLGRFFWRLRTELRRNWLLSPSMSESASLFAGLVITARLRTRERTPPWLTLLGTVLSGLLVVFTMVEERYANDETISIEDNE
ncbi:glycosyltransferase family 2 protein [Halocatena pleomorpha]|uniref:Glycosyltransferase family 2 protein n=1 Tax=Halocatena pleomorpha TaxID=1785090 RepID=A0A3P3RJE3_9EURY|nr:glycosyltransferase family 2 protein [Halocatena pleomorpha]RRJ33657.1 glycosyltransferase family 2 protein [Halocatena pleomorpha]